MTKVETMKKKLLREKRRELANELNFFCRSNSICSRCKNPEQKLAKGQALCDKCKAYYRNYAVKKK